MRAAIAANLLEISQERHVWSIKNADRPVKIAIYLRNKSAIEIDGGVVFSVKLSKAGLERQYLNAMIATYGEEKLRSNLNKGLREGRLSPKRQAIYNYIKRGKTLPDGKDYEPLPTPETKDLGDYTMTEVFEDYRLKFRRSVSLGPEAVDMIEHFQDLPPEERGFLLELRIDDIEFSRSKDWRIDPVGLIAMAFVLTLYVALASYVLVKKSDSK